MKLFTILRNLIQGIKNAKTYTDTVINAVDTRLDVLEEMLTLISETDVTGTASITIPSEDTWRFMFLTAYRLQGTTTVIYQNVINNQQHFGNPSALVLGGYYIANNDYGLCNVNLALDNNGGSVSLRNFYYGGISGLSTAHLNVRFFK